MSALDKQHYVKRWGALKLERASWFDHWQEISRFLLPRNGRFLISESSDGGKKHNNILDSTGTKALRVLGAGLMAGITSPARPWFRLTTADPDLADHHAVKDWLHEVTNRMRFVISQSNIYNALHGLYEELGAFGTACMLLMPDYDTVVRAVPFTIGEFAIDTDSAGRVNTVYRSFTMSVAQLIDEFGIDNVSKYVQGLYRNGTLDKRVEVVHAIEPRKYRDPNGKWNKDLPFASVYFEAKGSEKSVLREGGYKRLRVLAPRWSLVSGDIYGHSPGMEALGDLKQLQHQQRQKALAIDYMANPPVKAPAGTTVNRLPGGVTYYDSPATGPVVSNAFDVALDIRALLADIQDVRERIRQAFYADLFLMVSADDRSNVTAREIIERHEEKMLMLGPVLERLYDEILKPLIDIVFDDMLAAGLVPPPPKQLEGQDLEIELLSVLAQAQRAVGVQMVDRLIGTVATLANAKGDPSVWDKLDTDQIVDAYADMLGVDPSLIVADENVALLRKQRAELQAAQQQLEAAKAAAEVSSKMPEALLNTRPVDTEQLFQGY